MTERIDHAEEAKVWIETLGPYVKDDLRAALGIAQIEATLALVEQQRITNLLAWIEVDEGNGVDARFKRNLYRANIKEALGLS